MIASWKAQGICRMSQFLADERILGRVIWKRHGGRDADGDRHGHEVVGRVTSRSSGSEALDSAPRYTVALVPQGRAWRLRCWRSLSGCACEAGA